MHGILQFSKIHAQTISAFPLKLLQRLWPLCMVITEKKKKKKNEGPSLIHVIPVTEQGAIAKE